MAPGAEQILMAVAKLAWDAQDPKDQAALARQLPVQELIPRLAAKGLQQVTGVSCSDPRRPERRCSLMPQSERECYGEARWQSRTD